MIVARTINQLKEAIAGRRCKGSVGLVPTMGALHEGHLSLVERCRKENPTVVVSVFVNPTQFNDKNDLANYPRTEKEDFAMLEKACCDIVFSPSAEEVYPCPDTRQFDFGPIADVMEGASRPGHFNGVGQIVSKLFDYITPDKAYFGEKDFQQLAIIRKMTRDLALNIEIVGCDICRAKDGLALSSRNMLLQPEERAAAPQIYAALKTAAAKTWHTAQEAEKWVVAQIETNPMMKVEYFTIANEETLQPLRSWNVAEPRRGFVVVRLGNVRLIDNIKF